MLKFREWKFIAGQRGKLKLIVEGNSFYRTAGNGKRTYWSCSRVRTHNCRCKVITSRDSMTIRVNYPLHSHAPSLGRPISMNSAADDEESGDDTNVQFVVMSRDQLLESKII